MPNRIIRDAILDSDRYRDLAASEARLLFLEMLLLADDYGLLPVSAGFLSRRTTAAYGKSPEAIAGLISGMVDRDLIRTYSDGGRVFAYIPRFGNSPRAKAPKWPLPPEPSCSEINELRKKRIANATHLRANAPETETETETETEIQKKKIRAPRAASLPSAAPSGVSPEVWADFKTLRAKHRAPITPTAMAGIEREAAKAGLSLEDALRTCCERSWRGFKADWLLHTSGGGKPLYGLSGKPEEPSRYARPGLIGKMKELERRALEAKETER